MAWIGLLIAMLTFGAEAGNTASESAPVVDSVLCFDLVSQGDALHLLVGQPGGEEKPMTFSYLRRDGGRWSQPLRLTLDDERPYPHHRGSDACLAVQGEQLVAVWTNAGRGAMGSGVLACAFSSDGGRTWQRSVQPGADSFDASAKHGRRFPALAADPSNPGVFHLAWIDAFGEERRLAYARSDDGGKTWSDTRWLDRQICACCWNRMIVTPRGVAHLLYRNTQPSDMHVATIQGDDTRLAAACRFQWNFEGCPHVGGAIAARRSDQGEELHALVWTGAEDRLGLYHARSSDGGATWSDAALLSADGKHNDLAGDRSGAMVAVWDQPAGEGRVIMTARWLDAMGRWSEAQPLTPADRWSSHPRVIATPGGFLAAWTEHRQSRVGTLHLRALPEAQASR
jgi:hypothetical protein